MSGAITLSGLLAYLDGARLPAKVAADIRRQARDRLLERFEEGRADGVLDFADLVAMGEAALMGEAAP